jgi:hypothetical protein
LRHQGGCFVTSGPFCDIEGRFATSSRFATSEGSSYKFTVDTSPFLQYSHPVLPSQSCMLLCTTPQHQHLRDSLSRMLHCLPGPVFPFLLVHTFLKLFPSFQLVLHSLQFGLASNQVFTSLSKFLYISLVSN